MTGHAHKLSLLSTIKKMPRILLPKSIKYKKQDNDTHWTRLVTIRRDSDFYKPRGIIIRSNNFSPHC
jgi:hypothetical protein